MLVVAGSLVYKAFDQSLRNTIIISSNQVSHFRAKFFKLFIPITAWIIDLDLNFER